MIKFWKSAAKGKSGCPVRPPEPPETATLKGDVNNVVELVLEIGDKEDCSHSFEKKSNLTLSLHEILKLQNSVKYFIQYMETRGKYYLVKCWLELEEFKSRLSKTKSLQIDIHSKISRTQSFDQCQSNKSKQNSPLMYQAQDNSKKFNYNSSTSSCINLADQSKCIEPCETTSEAIQLFKKYVALEAPYQLDLPDNLRKFVISNICHPEGQIKEDCFDSVQNILFKQMEENYFSDFQKSSFYIKAQIDILTSGTLDLKDILYNESILFYFTEYLEQESCHYLLEFLMATSNFRDNLTSDTNLEQAESDAIILYDKYFSLQATTPIGFPSNIRLEIENNICREGGPLPSCFDSPFTIVYKTLSKYVKAFLESEIYYKYLSEMIHSVDHRCANYKSHSDCSSEFSLSTQNTLLAMGDPAFQKKKRNHSVPDMTIDSNQLYNADSLWQRKKYDGLILGRVNSLGRFESRFEPDPDKKGKSLLKKMVNKFVPTTTTNVEEEMAWQIAHMIVKDITDLTMAPPENDPEG